MSFSGSFNVASGGLSHMKNVDILKSLKALLCVSLELEPGPRPKAALLFLGCPSLVFASLPFVD